MFSYLFSLGVLCLVSACMCVCVCVVCVCVCVCVCWVGEGAIGDRCLACYEALGDLELTM